jgi:hypothetical protein
VLMNAYILVPEITLQIGLVSRPGEGAEFGRTESVDWSGMRHE